RPYVTANCLYGFYQLSVPDQTPYRFDVIMHPVVITEHGRNLGSDPRHRDARTKTERSAGERFMSEVKGLCGDEHLRADNSLRILYDGSCAARGKTGVADMVFLVSFSGQTGHARWAAKPHILQNQSRAHALDY